MKLENTGLEFNWYDAIDFVRSRNLWLPSLKQLVWELNKRDIDFFINNAWTCETYEMNINAAWTLKEPVLKKQKRLVMSVNEQLFINNQIEYYNGDIQFK